MRPIIEITATMTGPNEVFFQAISEEKYLGKLTFTLPTYRAFMDSLLTGSLAMGDRGVELIVTENGFENWEDGVCR